MKIVKIDLQLHPHYHLVGSDQCYYMREYSPRQGFTHGETNQLISNLKKPVSRRYHSDWKYKQQAITTCSTELMQVLGHNWLSNHTLVPIPPSEHKGDPDYDDRMLQVLNGLGNYDVREFIYQAQSIRKAHHQPNNRPTPRELANIYRIDQNIGQPKSNIAIFDDVLTSGAHFRAAKDALQNTYQQATIVGLFIARCKF